MKKAKTATPADHNEEIAALFQTLFETGRRIEELTEGQVDTLVDHDGRAFLLRGTHEQFLQGEMGRLAAVLNALTASVALLDRTGNIVSVNESWRQASLENSMENWLECGVGLNYLEVCDNARGEGSSGAHRAADGIRSVLSGDARAFSLEYDCHSPSEKRWFLLTVSPLAQGRPFGAIVMHLDITARKLAEESLRRSDERLRTLVMGIKDYAVFMLDTEGRIVTWNEGAECIKGYRADEIVGEHFSKFYTSDALTQGRPAHELKVAAEQGRYEEEGWRVRKDGSRFWANVVIRALYGEAGKLLGFAKVTRDNTERNNIESRLLSLTERLSLATSVAGVGVWEWDVATDMLTWDATMFGLYGLTPLEPMRYETWAAAVHPADLPVVEATLRRSIEERSDGTAEFRIFLPDGEVRHLSLAERVVVDQHAKVVRMIGVNMDVTERRQAEEALVKSGNQMTYLAEHDFLTGLPNRLLLKDRVGQAIESAKRDGKAMAVLFVDLDGFKQVNDSLGHATGDKLLQSVAKRLVDCVRTSDTVCRQGGDEFIVLLPEVVHAEDTAIAARRLMEAVAEVHMIAEQELQLSCCIGISVFPDDGTDTETLIRNADIAMYDAKSQKRPGFQFFRPSMNAQAVERQFLEESLRRAIERQEFALHYQPKINLRTGQITGVEALLRWTHPVRGSITPRQFIPVLEDCGLILSVGNWVLREACRQVKAWMDVGLPGITVAVNVSGVQLEAENFLEGLFACLNETGLDPNLLELEVTESLLMKRTDFATSVLRSVRDCGVQVALDDFGTGYSSLSCLHKSPVNVLKVDQSFIRQINSVPNQISIAGAIISMGRNLKMRIVAEGVETVEELDFLMQQRCDEAQGYYFSRPVPPEQFADLLEKQALSESSWRKDGFHGVSQAMSRPQRPAVLRRQ
jgi:diguanylate cyclase (GGDEF)-like protein/PAS domain S-box-containing protein